MLLVKFRVLCNKILVFLLCISLSIAQQTLFCLKWVQLCLYCSKFLQRGLVVWLKLTLFYLCFDVPKQNQIEKFNHKISQMVIIIISGKTPKSILKKCVNKWYHGLLSLNGQTPPKSSCSSLVIIILLSTIRQTPPKMVTYCSSVTFFDSLWVVYLRKMNT